MAEQKDSPNLFNPFMLWADWGMRAAEAAIASTQNLTNGADRVTRAVAGTEASEIADASSDEEDEPSTATAFDGIANMQRLAWDMAAQGWTRWMTAVAGIFTVISTNIGDPNTLMDVYTMSLAEYSAGKDALDALYKEPDKGEARTSGERWDQTVAASIEHFNLCADPGGARKAAASSTPQPAAVAIPTSQATPAQPPSDGPP